MAPFAFPALPSLPSFRTLIDTSPPVFYPAGAANDERDRLARSRRNSGQRATGDNGGVAGDARTRSRSRSITGADSPARRPARPAAPSGGLLAASLSTVDLTGKWEPLALPPLAGSRSRRNSTGAHASPTPDRRSIHCPPTAGSPSRPTHRRSQSTAALPPPLRRPYAPFGRLQDFSRNPFASASAISLPTLAELDGQHSGIPEGSASETTSPIVRPRNRRLSKASAISPVSPVLRSPPLSPRSIPEVGLPELDDLDCAVSESGRSTSSVPPPQNMGHIRPPPSPLSWSGQNNAGSRHRHSHSLSVSVPPMPQRQPILASSSVSDVAVLATWSFPSSPARRNDPAEQIGGRTTRPQQSDKLRERLRSLSQLDTSVVSPPEPARTGTTLPPPAREATSMRPSRPFLSHRHTHSSPTLLHPSYLPPPTNPAPPLFASTPVYTTSPSASPTRTPAPPVPRLPKRTTTTSRLRNPAPLSMPFEVPHPVLHSSQPSQFLAGTAAHIQSSGLSRSHTLSSSPGSMTDESSSLLCPSPTDSTVSLPPPNLGSVGVSAREEKKKKNGMVWWKRGTEPRNDDPVGTGTRSTSVREKHTAMSVRSEFGSSEMMPRSRTGSDGDQVSVEKFLNYEDI